MSQKISTFLYNVSINYLTEMLPEVERKCHYEHTFEESFYGNNLLELRFIFRLIVTIIVNVVKDNFRSLLITLKTPVFFDSLPDILV